MPSGSRRTPSGPTDPATQASPACFSLRCSTAWRARCTPAALISATFAGKAVPRQPEAVGAEGVGFKNLGAGLQILLVDGENQAGVGEVQLVVAAVDEDAARVEHGAHGAVGEHGTVGKDVGKQGILLSCYRMLAHV